MHPRLIHLARQGGIPFFLTVASLWLNGAAILIQAWLFSRIVDAVFLQGYPADQSQPLLRLLLGVILLRSLLSGLHEVSARAIATQVKSVLRRRFFEHLQALGPLYTRGQRTGELTTVAVEGIEALDAYYSQFLPQVATTILIPLTLLIVVFSQDALSGGVMLVTAPLIPFFMVLIGRGTEVLTRRQYLALSRLAAQFLDSFQGLTALKLLGRARQQEVVLKQASEAYSQATLRVLRLTFLSAFALELLATISTALIAVEVALRLLYGYLPFQTAFFVLILAPEFYLPFRLLGLRFHAGMAGITAAEQIWRVLDTPAPRFLPTATPPPAPLQAIELEDVSFTYPGEPRPALQHITLRLEAGQQVALIGPSGAGKSTLMGLVMGFLQPTSGRIRTLYADGTRLPGPPPLPTMAWVDQSPHIFHTTLEANLRLARPEATPEELQAALEAAGLAELVRTLPEGLRTVVGEAGLRLSGGEAQRLALARAFLKDAQILLLDEPTSALDPDTEALLMESTRRLLQGRTALIIAHRLYTVQHADRVIVLENGRIVEEGPPEELLGRRGAYAQMMWESAKTRALFQGKDAQEPERLTLPQVPSPAVFPDEGEAGLSPPSSRATGWRLMKFLGGAVPLALLAVLLGALTVGSNVALIGVSAWLIAASALRPPLGSLQIAIVAVRFFGMARAVLRYAERLLAHAVTFHMVGRIRVWFYRTLEPLAPARLLEQRSGDVLARMMGDVEVLENFFVRILEPVGIAAVTAVALGGFLAHYSPALALVVLGAFILTGAVLPVGIYALSRKPGRHLVVRRGELSSLIVDGIQGLADLLAYERAGDYAREMAVADRAYVQAQHRLAVISALHTSFSTLITHLAFWGVLWLTIPMVQAGQVKGTLLGALGLLTVAAFEAVTPLPQAAQLWGSVDRAGRRLLEVADTPPPILDPPPSAPHPRPVDFSLAARALTFTYPGSTQPALQDITWSIPEGATVAIVGPSGAGKTTLIHLLLRFWDYQQGDLRLGGVPLKAMPAEAVRNYFSVLSQRPYLFSATVRENLLLAHDQATPEQLEQVIYLARLEELLARLPQGLDTYLGEHGWRLSAGERQRLALAQALLRPAPILILDEPTAHLDAHTEQEVIAALRSVTRHRTTLWITHRLIGMEWMDEIIVLQAGRIVERGTHDALLAHRGLYRRMWELQHTLFRDGRDSS